MKVLDTVQAIKDKAITQDGEVCSLVSLLTFHSFSKGMSSGAWSFCVAHSISIKLTSWACWHHKAHLLKEDTEFWSWGCLKTSPFAWFRLGLARWQQLSPRPSQVFVQCPASILATVLGLSYIENRETESSTLSDFFLSFPLCNFYLRRHSIK